MCTPTSTSPTRCFRPSPPESLGGGGAGFVAVGPRWVGATVLGVGLVLAGCSAKSSTPSAAGTVASSTTATPTTAAERETTTTSEDPVSSSVERSSTSSTAASGAGACTLLTEADATEAFGEPAVAADQSTDECWWESGNELKRVNLIIRQPDLDSWRQGHQNDSWESVSLGDEGFAGKVLDSVEFRVGDTVYEINVVYSTKGDAGAAVQQLAEKVASRV